MRPVIPFFFTISELLVFWLLLTVPIVLVWAVLRGIARSKKKTENGCLTRFLVLTLTAGVFLVTTPDHEEGWFVSLDY